MRAAALIALLSGLAACQDPLTPQSHVDKLRVLAMRAEPPELVLRQDAGLPATTFQALAVNPSGDLPSTAFALCTLQNGGTPSATLDCPGAAGIDLPDAGPNAARLDFNNPAIQALALQLSQQDGGLADAGGLQAQLAQGIPLLIGFTASAPPGGYPDGGPPGFDGGPQQLRGFTTIKLRTASDQPVNRNPQIIGLQSKADGGVAIDLPDDGGFSIHAGQEVQLTPVPAADAKEQTPNGPETLGYTFFSTGGALSSLRTTDTTATGEPVDTFTNWSAPPQPGPVQFWVIIRDGRGGTGWLTRTVQVVP